MKKFSLLSVLLVMFSALSITSCDTEPVDPVLNDNINNPDNPNNPNPEEGVFTVDFGGETFIAESAEAKYEQGLLTIVGAKSSAELVSMSVSGTTEGTYNEALMNYFPGGNSQTGYMNLNPETLANNGSVVITEIDYDNNTISGTFSFTGYSVNPDSDPSEIVFTNGSFENVPVTGLPDPGTNPVGQPYMKAKIDGELVNFGTIMVMGEGDFWSLNGTNAASQESLSITLQETITPGTYNLETFTDYYATYISFAGIDIPSDSGSITIISHANGWIKGTFSFSGEDFDGNQHSVTEGEFNIQY